MNQTLFSLHSVARGTKPSQEYLGTKPARALGRPTRKPVTWRSRNHSGKASQQHAKFPGVCGVTKEPKRWSHPSNNVRQAHGNYAPARYLPPLKTCSVFGHGTPVASKQQSSDGIIVRSGYALARPLSIVISPPFEGRLLLRTNSPARPKAAAIAESHGCRWNQSRIRSLRRRRRVASATAAFFGPNKPSANWRFNSSVGCS